MVAALVAALVAAGGCGKPTPRHQQRTAAEWSDMLWVAEAPRVNQAVNALVALALRDEAGVLSALERHLSAPAPKADASPFTVIYDANGAKRLGLTLPDQGEANRSNVPVVQARVEAFGFAPVSIRSAHNHEMDVVGLAAHPRAVVERMQAALVRRGALEIRLVVPDPAAPPPTTSLRARVYDDPTPYAERLEAEVARHARARQRDEAYVPASPRWRAVPRAGAPLRAASSYVLVEEPLDDAEAIDERIVGHAVASTDPDGAADGVANGGGGEGGSAWLGVAVRPERREAVRRFSQRNVGLSMAVILDGEVIAVGEVRGFDGKVFRFPLGAGPTGTDLRTWAQDLALLLPTGRMPFPFKPLPLPERLGSEPAPDNPFSRVLALLGDRARPLMEKVSGGAYPAWAKATVAWARDHTLDR